MNDPNEIPNISAEEIERRNAEGACLEQLIAAQESAQGVEKFSAPDLLALRGDLLRSGVDSFQAAEIVASFLTGRGYGCSPQEARNVASNIEVQGMTTERIQAELERVARAM